MKKITLVCFAIISFSNFAQQKSTGVVSLASNINAELLLDNATSTVTLTLSGPNDRYFALQFGSFEFGMQVGTDLVYWNNSTLVDAKQNGIGAAPITDPINNWTLVTNQNNFPSTGIRTLVYTRPFNTGDSNDYTFNFVDSTIDLAWARASSASFTMANHGGANRGLEFDIPLTTLGVDNLSFNSTKLFPNPTKGVFTINTDFILNEVHVYTHTGLLVKTIHIDDVMENTSISLNGLVSGIYLIELVSGQHKTWKKIILN